MEKSHPLATKGKKFYDPLTGNLIEENRASLSHRPKECNSINEENSRKFLNRFPFGGSVPYLKEYELICDSVDSQEIFNWGLNCDFAACRFRSICWRVFLKVLPPSVSKWLTVMRKKREAYETMRHTLAITPDLVDEHLDPSVNNPLSQDEESPWNQYFEDSELKRLIRLDVKRTFPEIDFFQLPRIQEMMISVLFCYARKYPRISYVQGMHEVLAPLTFVINCDHVAHAHIMDQNDTPKLLQELMDQAYLEHDSFALFEVVMDRLSNWYEDTDFRPDYPSKVQILKSQPFSRPQDIGPATKIVKRLTKVHDILLKKFEPEIFMHLGRHEIPPQVYGIRWARLMLGREFLLTDLLTIWDAIFADQSENFILLEFLMVAMLSYIKEDLLASDYIPCLNMLMRYPSGADVQTIVKLAIHFRNPKLIPRPVQPSPLQPPQTIGGQHSIHREPQPPTKSHNHHSITRSSSLPRPSSGASHLKHRSTSVDQRPRSSGESRNRRTSPTVEAIESHKGFAFHAREDSSTLSNDEGGALLSRTRVMSGLVRFGERFAKPPANGNPPEPGEMNERPMNELSIVKRSAPIPATKGDDIGDNTVSPLSSSTESEDNLSFVQKNIKTGRCRRPSAEDLQSICFGCALRLSNHRATLSTRLAQLNIESDFTVRAAMEGITEVIETLKQVKMKGRKPNSPEKVLSSMTQESSDTINFTHPLMNCEES